METAGPSGASGLSLDYSVYNMSDEELIQIAIERSLSEDHNTTPSTDTTRQTPCPPNAEVRQPSSTPHVHRTSTQPGTPHLHRTSAQPGTPHLHSTSAQPGTPHLHSTSAQPGTPHLHSTSAQPGTPHLHSTSAQPGTPHLHSTSAQPGTPHLHSTSAQPGTPHLHRTSAQPGTPVTPHLHSTSFNYSSQNPPTAKPPDVEDPQFAKIRAIRTLLKLHVLSSKPDWLSIHQAAFHGQDTCLRVLLTGNTAQPGMVNKKTAKEQTALMLAVEKQHTGCVRLLLENGANPEIVNEDRETPLYKACERNNAELVAILLNHRAAVNTPCIHGHTALHEAARQNNVDICEMLVDAGAKVHGMTPLTPLAIAAQGGKLEALCFLLKHGADINGAAADGATPLYEACKNGRVSIVEVLLSLKADVNRSTKSGLLPIHVAVQKAYARIVSLLIPVTCRNRIMISGVSPLHIAAENNCNDIMELLLEAGFDPDFQLSEERRKKYEDKRSTALYFSVYNSNLEATEMLLEAGANPNLDLSKPLLLAIKKGSLGVASLLLKYGADVNASISTKPSAFPSAVLLSMDHLPMLKLLLDHGCNARSCFTCVYGSKPHPTQTHSEERRNWNRDAPRSCVQFCEAVSKPSIMVGPLISLLLNYVSHVRLCSRLMERLVSSPLCTEVKLKAVPPHPLMQLCRLRIRHLVGADRLKLLRDLDLPSRLIRFLCYEVDCSLDLDT